MFERILIFLIFILKHLQNIKSEKFHSIVLEF